LKTKKIYYEYNFQVKNPEVFRDILIAVLAESDFEGFTETSEGFLAYIDKKKDVEKILTDFQDFYDFTVKEILPQNWNKKWESIIQPLIIENQVYIRTSFHPEKNFPYIINIDPKMSFGTGHHETTELMIRQMLNMDFVGKTVIDIGAGTGVLSILAEQLGAQKIFAVDIDEWSFDNMKENFEKNLTEKIEAFWGDATFLKEFPKADIVLANINLNVLLDDFDYYNEALKNGGKLLMSGFLSEDIPILKKQAKKYGMKFEKVLSKNDWQSMLFSKVP